MTFENNFFNMSTILFKLQCVILAGLTLPPIFRLLNMNWRYHLLQGFNLTLGYLKQWWPSNMSSGGGFNIKMSSNPYRNFHYRDKTILSATLLSPQWPDTGKMSSLYWIRAQTPIRQLSWWRYQMEIFSALQAICAGNSPVPGEFPAQRPVTRNFDVFFDLRPNKLLSQQSWGWLFETPSRPLWRHRNGSFS